ncbi:MAG: hypothetical protein ACRC67_13705 [Inquilinus sp.]|uniref:hypothetical protein n=1 Tax=Inquilinus sp. TaxID=1932117 RepID=UPI003F3A8E1F
MASEEWAAWVQAVASILGIGLAFFFPWQALRVDREALAAERRERELERQGREAERKSELEKVAEIVNSRMRRFALITSAKIEIALEDLKDKRDSLVLISLNEKGSLVHALQYQVDPPWSLAGLSEDAFLFNAEVSEQFFVISRTYEGLSRIQGISGLLDSGAQDFTIRLMGGLYDSLARLRQDLIAATGGWRGPS